MPTPAATYRLQLGPGLGFDQAAELAGYLARLGVSHAYASPVLQASPGSTHGYDVVDPTRVSEELGGAAGFARFSRALGAHELGIVLDVVPNHMAVGNEHNAWWWDVLENGHSSKYADYFDVEWEPTDVRGDNRIMLPILGDHYGRVLEKGELALGREGGRLVLRYYDHKLPVAPRSLGPLLERAGRRAGSDDRGFIASAYDSLPLSTATDRPSVRRRHRDKEVLARQLARLIAEEETVAEAVDAVVAETNADPDALDRLIQQQNYRLAFWRTAGRELGYRRFFDIDSLAGVRVDDEVVFADTHALPVDWVRRGMVQGLRIDHPDGIRDPHAYLRRLRDATGPDAWIVVEKILHPGEALPPGWSVEGTTGYDFMFVVGSLLVDPAAEEPLTRFYAELTGEPTEWADVVRDNKHHVMRDTLGSEVNRVTELMLDVCELHRRHRDYTRDDVRRALRELIACFPVYRSYVRADEAELDEQDREVVEAAVAEAQERRPEIDPELFAFLEDLMCLRVRGEAEAKLVMALQQVTGAVMAKGAEDTSFYCFNRFVAANEVGGDPARFGLSLDEFHREMARRAEELPSSMLSTATHDTKRSEDVRARLFVLSEMPARWEETVRGWVAQNARHRRGDYPDRNAEYLIYQNLVGAWPIDADRMTAYAQKAAREAKQHTSWTRQDATYEDALRSFVEGILSDEDFTRSVDRFVATLEPAARANSLAQKLITLTAPGVPDVYRGTELWDHSLVDPDNRRPVDFGLRQRLLGELEELEVPEVLARMDEGLPKLWVVHRALRLRGELPEAFAPGASYQPLRARGERADHVVAFLRGERALTVVPRLSLRLAGEWRDTTLELPRGEWRDVLGGASHRRGETRMDALLGRFPVALLVREERR